jgi:hypothetical protein
MDDTSLNLRLGKDGMNRFFKSGQAVDAGNEMSSTPRACKSVMTLNQNWPVAF